ncbi:hypothetical protein HBF26_17135 [Luteibacter jiangsuensis]|uniref:Hemolysin XhlA n=1 Tax=Luteibacter jiangsuensis TaxID=637577 RepID=A0ABX0Q8G1_9GAMM|nr:hypothetical protein [Luteibacter jiangsuensis]NID06622.1 hypothetical protein [Luteibacter jiangsuensis]
MSDALLRSIDTRLQKVSEDVGAMKLQINTVESDIKLVKKDVEDLPTWKGAFGAASAAVGLVGTAIAWLANGGAATIARWFGVGS